jgi:hypothetical protein
LDIPRAMRRSKVNWIGHILHSNCLIKHVVEGKIEGKRRRSRRRKLLLDEQKGKRRYLYLKEEALDCTLWRTRFGIGYGPVARKATEGNAYRNIGNILLQKADTQLPQCALSQPRR